MSRMNSDVVEALLDRDHPADVTLCLHSMETHLWSAGDDSPPMSITRLVGHLVVDDLEPGQEAPGAYHLVVDIPLTPTTLNGTAGHFRGAMKILADHTMESLMEDGL